MKKIYVITGNGSGGLHHNFGIGDRVIVIAEDGDSSKLQRLSDKTKQFVSTRDYGPTKLWYVEDDDKINYSEPYVHFDKSHFKPSIKNIYANESKKCVAVKFEDEDVKVIHCSENDSFDIYVGVALAIAKKAFGSSEKFHNKVDRILKKGNK